MIAKKAKRGTLVYQYGSPAKCGIIIRDPTNKSQTYVTHGQEYELSAKTVLVRWITGKEEEMYVYALQPFTDLIEGQRTKLARHEERLLKLGALKELLNL